MKCKLCGHEWQERKDFPVSCPKCKRYDFFESPKGEGGTENEKSGV